ncbi:hypothetical protein FEDK69T_28100 [Flavobacterium enshiense DK69]|uniref:DUF5723 domain-containing protein n=1 Tax=Flavobacterium enshiense DK69 TaxID=1107311 RepID=V6S216_9FLAO|nr:hypothetical protein [Flavobacterium enshiense]ESU20297.1 hypothetical protein FEDK69T_28100 [Flavobacterium enshiense DK69]KGO95891.1 hypothetical protein Q767_09420 [Flavobacterium enshiense DK69]
MKKTLLTFIALFSLFLLEAQVKIDDLKTPDSPGFQILDISPTSIEKPINPQALGLTLLSQTNNGTGLPSNFAMEVSPYWYFKDSKASIHKYLNIRTDNKPTATMSGILQKLSISMASVYSDTISGSLQAKTNYLSFGIRTNLFTYRLSKQNKYLMGTLEKISNKVVLLKPKEIITDDKESEKKRLESENEILKDQISISTNDVIKKSLNETLEKNNERIQELNEEIVAIEMDAPDTYYNVLKEDKELKSYLKELDAPPLIQIDGAFAYSEAFLNNTFDNKRFNRSGVWANVAINSAGMTAQKANYNFSAVGLVKFINDNVLTDTVNNLFEHQNALDIGIKVDFQIKDFSMAYEHIHRNFSESTGVDSDRNVFIIQYEITDGLYFTGSYGKNFGEVNNLFTLFGINYGFGDSPLTVKQE